MEKNQLMIGKLGRYLAFLRQLIATTVPTCHNYRLIIITLNHGLNARRSPIYQLFLTMVSFSAIGIGSGVLGFRPYCCPSLFPSPSILGVFHSHLSAIGVQSCFFFTADVSPPIRSTLRLLTFYM